MKRVLIIGCISFIHAFLFSQSTNSLPEGAVNNNLSNGWQEMSTGRAGFRADKFRGGLSSGILIGKDAIHLYPRIGFEAGASRSYKWLTEKYFYHEMVVELGYIQRGTCQDLSGYDLSNIEENQSLYEDIGTLKINSVYLGLLYKTYLTHKFSLRPSITAGFRTNFNIGGYIGGIILDKPSGVVMESDVITSTRYFNLDLVAGFGIDVSIGKHFRAFGIEYRYNHGLSPVLKKNSDGENWKVHSCVNTLTFILYVQWK